jgi:alginate O-acetyltransferase complex protein AlgJ
MKNNRISVTAAKTLGWSMVLCFLLVIGIAPVLQLVKEIYSGEPLQEFDLFKRTPTVANLRAYENEMEDNSIIAKKARPWYQWLSTHLADQGNGKAVIGRDEWLFYRPSIDYITKSGSNFHRSSGPLPAITAFHRDLKSQGVDLILLPVPGKATIYPEYLSRRYNTELGPPVNPYAPEFFHLLREEGIQVLDPIDALWKAKTEQAANLHRSTGNGDKLLYLPQDTHWSTLGMKLVARYLARAIKAGTWLKDVPRRFYTVQPVEVKRFGDLYDMLDLPEGHSVSEPMSVTVEKVVDMEAGEPCVPDTSSPIVLLGDSFVNVFSEGEMGWGEHAGLAEHLALQLGVSIDVIAINDGGPTTTRESLARRANALVGKRLVIWQFATRDLVDPGSEWKIVNIPKPQTEVAEVKHPSPSLVVIAEVAKVSLVPDPSQVAYTECVTYIKYRVMAVEQGQYQDEVLIAVFWGMKDSKLMPAARFQIGEKHRLSLDLFEDHEELSHIMQADDTDDYEHTPFWVLEMSQHALKSHTY